MNINISVLIHGVPEGQKFWPEVTGQTKQYLASFYTTLMDQNLTEFMKVERLGEYVYYTLVKCHNVSDVNGRTGSYFAETLRMNVYYTDIQNIYSILEAAYKKLYVGVCVTDDGNNFKYCIHDFSQVSSELNKHNKILIDTIGSFSVDNDLKLPSTVANSKGKQEYINLQDCNSSKALQIMKDNGCLFVSPQYMSEYSKKLKQQNEAEIKRLKKEYETRIHTLELDMQRKEQENLSGKDSLNRQIENLKAENNALNNKVNELSHSLEDVMQSIKVVLKKFNNSSSRENNKKPNVSTSQEDNLQQDSKEKKKPDKRKKASGFICMLIFPSLMIVFFVANIIFLNGAMNSFNKNEELMTRVDSQLKEIAAKPDSQSIKEEGTTKRKSSSSEESRSQSETEINSSHD